MPTLNQNIPHDSAHLHASGTSTFIDDIPPRADELFLELFTSPIAHGRLVKLHLEAALKIPGVLRILTAADIPGHNIYGPIMQDEHLLASDLLTFIGDPIALVIATSRAAALAARKLITADITPLPPIFSIDDAIAAKQFIGPQRVIETGSPAEILAQATPITTPSPWTAVHGPTPSPTLYSLEGTLAIGGQEHFYLESQAAIAYPDESKTIHILSSTQHPTECQQVTAEILGVPFNHVTVECRRMGGGFGGKETQAAPACALAALAAHLTGRPARLVLDRDTDMAITGKRHPFKAFYKIAFTPAGRITALSVDLFSNGGCTCDLSPSILERAMLHADNAYFLPHARITGRICKTNLPSNTAFRGFGGPQGVAVIESLLQQIAATLHLDPYDLRQLNCYGAPPPIENGNSKIENLTTPYGQEVQNNVLPRLFTELRSSSHYDQRRREISIFNAQSTSHLRGLAMTPVKFGISFTKKTLNQANALVNIYLDGSVLVTTGGTEMGQGLYTRVRQLVADDLGLPIHSVRIAPTRTDKNNNTSPTAASAGTDLNGAAALDATRQLRQSLATFAAPLLSSLSPIPYPLSPTSLVFQDAHIINPAHPSQRIPFQTLVQKAYEDRINLGARGFYITPGVDFNRDTGKGTPFLYYTNGAAVAEVLINRYTGELQTPRVDILMDAGIPLNPGIDRGQITGGFLQGLGWVTTEELVYDPAGNLLSHSPTTYKIPNISDTPEIFNVHFLLNPDSTYSLKRSKALGEPPLLLGLSVHAAIQNALTHASSGTLVNIPLPATPEAILMALTRIKSQHKELVVAK